MEKTKYWMAVVSKEHSMRGVTGGFMQVCHGKQAPLKRMKPNDWLIVYSPKMAMDGDLKCQAFTAIGQVADHDVYQYEMSENFIPFRRNIKFRNCEEVLISPLIPDLEFIKNKRSWGYAFRFGFFEIGISDFELISKKMIKDGR